MVNMSPTLTNARQKSNNNKYTKRDLSRRKTSLSRVNEKTYWKENSHTKYRTD